MMQQDSGDPTGISATNNQRSVREARKRKAESALELRLSGATWEQIARALGYPTPRQAIVAVEKTLALQLANRSDRTAMRDLAGARLERLLRSVWGKAINPEDPEHLNAVTKAREVLAQHAKLFGLDAPTEVVVHSPTTQEIERWVAQVVSHSLPVVEEYDIIDVDEDDDDDDGSASVPALVG